MCAAKTIDSPIPGASDLVDASMCCLCGELHPNAKTNRMTLCNGCDRNLPFRRRSVPYVDTPGASLYSGVYCCVCGSTDLGDLNVYPVCKDGDQCQLRFMAYLGAFPSGKGHSAR